MITEETVALALQKEFGLRVAPDEVRLEQRTWRWVAHLPGDLVAYMADSAEAAQQLARERAVLGLLKERVSFGVPVVEFVNAADRLQVRRKIPGIQVGGGPERRIGNSSIGARLADDLGRAFAELHRSITLEECEVLGVGRGRVFLSANELAQRLTGRLTERRAVDALKTVLNLYANLEIPPEDLVFTHGDPWGGNFAVDPDTGALNGLFDFDEMAVDDRNLDLRFLHSFSEKFKRLALTAYAQLSDSPPSLKRINLYHLVSAFDALAHSFVVEDQDKIARRRQWVEASIDELLDELT